MVLGTPSRPESVALTGMRQNLLTACRRGQGQGASRNCVRCMLSTRACHRRRQCEHCRQSSPHSVDILRLRNIGSSLSNQTSRSRLGVQAAIIPQRNHCKLLIGHLQDRAVRRYFMINAVASAELQDAKYLIFLFRAWVGNRRVPSPPR